jgi:hypothetical protein
MLRTGFNEVLVTGILIKCIKTSAIPIDSPANPFGDLGSVAPRMINKNIKVITNSATIAAIKLYSPGECLPYPFAAKLPISLPFPVTIIYRTPAASIV